MKKNKWLILVCLLIVTVVALTGCGKKEKNEIDYSTYIGQFEGIDPWGNKMSVTFRKLKGNKLDWAYGDGYETGAGEPIRVFSEQVSKLENGIVSFKVEGDASDGGYTFEYSGTLSLKDDIVTLKYESGQLTPNGAKSGIYRVDALDEGAKTVVLEKYSKS